MAAILPEPRSKACGVPARGCGRPPPTVIIFSRLARLPCLLPSPVRYF